ncbi:Z1 domain-containing protein [Sporolactobacillus sp. THM19-2]|uniref:Z1 domain-containing protein n=1 Tax=Sporolactobacillus sp. THM19-2 TaxID=2511171 RepID=UPI0010227A08|nr:Z1 domain-containing protein [Sporolactobacillus sp. THM19-2]RYL92398.1 endonuclease [Sporolactobacillus sp. THM19-2]
MTDTRLPKYDDVRDVIKMQKKNGRSWETIENNYDNLKDMGLFDKNVNKDIWREILHDTKAEYDHAESIEKIDQVATLVSTNEDNETTIPTDPRSSWQLYKENLRQKGWKTEAVRNLEISTSRILKKLNRNTSSTGTGPIKGLVIGQVQSGKTSSMAGLMAMAADWGWNTFIVLSGMIENLREQTQKRLFKDLNHPGNTVWRSLSDLSRNSPTGNRLSDLNFSEGAPERFLYVCLKNKTRLENLISWLRYDTKQLHNLRILVIDDEADQASINTKKDDRARINQLIINLVDIGKDIHSEPAAMNYVSYTATPYSNFLNESAPESLYPKDFICVLPVSNEYFGPKQIFGLEGSEDAQGIDIIREISDEDRKKIKNIQNGIDKNIPESLQDSICWFFCAVAVMRLWQYKKPVSMLIHTSQIQLHHSEVADALTRWINQVTESDLLRKCKTLYEAERARFSISDFRSSFRKYPVPNEKINDYPEFNRLKTTICELKQTISHIKMSEEGELKYHNGVHLCIDNSANNGINDENMHIRLAYPEESQLKKLDEAPAFIIVGGSTLSRGLTIEGLVSTYFLRAANSADTLMQMGRWFGYRKGYELLPRIWMTQATQEKFIFLSTLEEELRDELDEYSLGNKKPSDYGPRVKNTPKVSWLRVTSRNKMQEAEEVDLDFSGASIQTIHFENNKEILRHNLDVTDQFLAHCCVHPIKSKVKSALFFKGVKFTDIKNEFLTKMEFSKKTRVFNQIEAFCEWYEKVKKEMNYKDWNVIVAGSGEVIKISQSDNKKINRWRLGDFMIGKVTRSAKLITGNGKAANIGVLRGPNDVFADIEDESFYMKRNKEKSSSKDIRETRDRYGLNKVPQLIIYRIDKDSKARDSSSGRKDLNFDEDIIGVYINIPGDSSSKPHAKALRVRIEKIDNEDDE